jgi:hypothetical protein
VNNHAKLLVAITGFDHPLAMILIGLFIGGYSQKKIITKITCLIGVILFTGALRIFKLPLSRLNRSRPPSNAKITGVPAISFGKLLLVPLISKQLRK